MASETTIPVEITDLQQLHEVFLTVYNLCKLHDLEESYRQMTNSRQWSPMTYAVERTVAIVQSYLEQIQEEGDEDNAKS